MPEDTFSLPCTAAVLMERESGALLYAKNEYQHLAPASVTKVMTLLLVTEAVESGSVKAEDTVTASRRAASMGGSIILCCLPSPAALRCVPPTWLWSARLRCRGRPATYGPM